MQHYPAYFLVIRAETAELTTFIYTLYQDTFLCTVIFLKLYGVMCHSLKQAFSQFLAY